MLKFAIIGCGRISYKHVQAVVDNHPNAKLVAVCDVVYEKALEKKSDYETKIKEVYNEVVVCNAYEKYEDMFANETIDVVAIATESGYHYKHTIDSLNNGCNVIVEKPMALNVAHADEMIQLAKEKNLKLAVSHQNRFNPPIQLLRKAVEEGRFGRIIAGNARILWNRNKGYYEQAPWRGTYEMDGGALMNQCIHNIDLLQWMLGGDVKKVNAMLDNFVHPYIEAEDYGSIQIRFGSGAIGNIEGTVNVWPKNLEETLTILGEEGTVVIGGLAVNEIKTWQFKDEKDSLDEVVKLTSNTIDNVYGNGHTPLFADFIDSVNNNRKPYIDGEDGKIAMSIILKAYELTR